MNPTLRTLTFIIGMLIATPLWAAGKVIDVPTRAGVTQRLLMLKAERPLAVLLVLAGGERPLGIADDGSLAWGSASLLIRISPLFVQRGFTVTILDIPSGQQSAPDSHFRESAEHAQDIAAIIAFLHKDSQLPVWLIGTGSGTTSVLNTATRLPKNGADGIILTSSISDEYAAIIHQKLDKVRIPVLSIHKNNPCLSGSQSGPGSMIAAFKNSPKAEELGVGPVAETGSNSCQTPSSHGYLGLESQLVDKISSWVKAILLPAGFI